MQVAGIRRVGARVEMIEAGELRSLAEDEVLLEVRAAHTLTNPVPRADVEPRLFANPFPVPPRRPFKFETIDIF
jgi:hypothetical protein